jgi:hypothetical protein
VIRRLGVPGLGVWRGLSRITTRVSRELRESSLVRTRAERSTKVSLNYMVYKGLLRTLSARRRPLKLSQPLYTYSIWGTIGISASISSASGVPRNVGINRFLSSMTLPFLKSRRRERAISLLFTPFIKRLIEVKFESSSLQMRRDSALDLSN